MAQEHQQFEPPLWLISGITVATYSLIHPAGNIQLFQQIQHLHPYLKQSGLLSKRNFNYASWIIQRDGLLSLWRGTLSGILITQEILIQQDILKKLMKKYPIPERDAPKSWEKFFKNWLLNFSVQSIGILVVYPIYTIYFKMMDDIEPVRKYSGILDCLIQIFNEGGIKGIYKGFNIRILKIFIDTFLSSIAYNYGIKGENDLKKDHKYFIVTILSALITYPLDSQNAKAILGYKDLEVSSGVFGWISDNMRGALIELSPRLIHYFIFNVTEQLQNSGIMD